MGKRVAVYARDAEDYARFDHWRLYGRRDLRRKRVAVWLADDVLTLERDEETLAQLRVRFAPDDRPFRETREPGPSSARYHPSPLAFWELDDAARRKAVPVRPYAARHRRPPKGQPALPLTEVAHG